jgi:hypothetical protein
MNRRDMLKRAGLLAAGAATGCSSRPAPSAPSNARPKLKLAPVKVSKDRIIRTVVGLRPFRSSGFRVEKEKLGRKMVVHNYGHGGGGITLSWGTSQLAVDELFRDGAPEGKVAVLGAGAVGLATSRLLQRRGIEVTLYAKELPPHTTSNIAAGQWSPYFVSDFGKRSARFREQFGKAARIAHRQFQDLLGDHYGVRFLMNYVLSDHPFGPEPGEGSSGNEESLDDLFPESRLLYPGQHPFPVKHVRQFQTMLVEPPVYLEALLRDFLLAKGNLVIRELHSASELQYLPETAIVNCTGLGSSALFDDTDLRAL